MKRGGDSPGSSAGRVTAKAIGSPPSKSGFKHPRQGAKELAVMDVSDLSDLKAGCTT